MKHTLLLTLSSFIIATLMTACTGQIADEMAVIGNPTLSSDPCAAIDEKVIKLDRFTEVVKNTSAFHLEEKANAIPTPGITISNNRKQMLKDADKKYAEYDAERQKYGCKTPVSTGQVAAKMPIIDQCAAIDNKVFRLDRFTEVVKNTSAFHLEEKANAISTPGITVSNNKRQMLKDADKKYAEYAAEHKKYGCKNPITTSTSQIAEKMTVSREAALSSGVSAVTVQEPVKSVESTTKVNASSAVDLEERATAVPVAENTPSNNKEQIVVAAEKKDAELPTGRQTSNVETPIATVTVPDHSTFSSEKCNDLDEDLIELSEFTSMVKNTSAFHLEEKASALPSPGFTVSNNKKKMLRDIEKKHSKLIAEREKYGCEPLTGQ